MAGQLILFPTRKARGPSCFICVKAAFGEDGETICTVVGEVIDLEGPTARACETYQEDRDAT